LALAQENAGLDALCDGHQAIPCSCLALQDAPGLQWLPGTRVEL